MRLASLASSSVADGRFVVQLNAELVADCCKSIGNNRTCDQVLGTRTYLVVRAARMSNCSQIDRAVARLHVHTLRIQDVPVLSPVPLVDDIGIVWGKPSCNLQAIWPCIIHDGDDSNLLFRGQQVSVLIAE